MCAVECKTSTLGSLPGSRGPRGELPARPRRLLARAATNCALCKLYVQAPAVLHCTYCNDAQRWLGRLQNYLSTPWHFGPGRARGSRPAGVVHQHSHGRFPEDDRHDLAALLARVKLQSIGKVHLSVSEGERTEWARGPSPFLPYLRTHGATRYMSGRARSRFCV